MCPVVVSLAYPLLVEDCANMEKPRRNSDCANARLQRYCYYHTPSNRLEALAQPELRVRSTSLEGLNGSSVESSFYKRTSAYPSAHLICAVLDEAAPSMWTRASECASTLRPAASH